MYSFFIAIIGAIILFSRFSKSNNNEKVYNKEMGAWKDKYHKACNVIPPSRELREFIEEYVDSGKHVEEIYNEIEDNLIKVFGKEYRRYFILEKYHEPSSLEYTDEERKSVYYQYSKYNTSFFWAKQLLYSKRGYSVGVLVDYTLGDDHHKYNDMKLCYQVLKNLKESGVEDRLGFKLDIELKHKTPTPGVPNPDDYYLGEVKFIFGD